MKKLTSLLLVWLILVAAGLTQSNEKVASAAQPAASGALRLTPENSKIEFFGSKIGGQHTGGFKQFSGTIELPGGEIRTAKINVDIDVNSIYTDTPKLTGHLKTPDFFDVKTHPKATFVSQTIEPSPSGEATHKITGNLTLHGVTKPISFPAKITLTDSALTIHSKFSLSRKEFAMNYRPEIVNDEVKLTIAVTVPRK